MIMLKESRYQYLLLFFVHVAIAAVAFQHFWAHPHDVWFAEVGDGLKNIFTLTSYVKEPIPAEGIFKYNMFHYPFGEYVYYTDNNPLFALPFKWICHHVYDLSDHTMEALYLVLILNIILCGLLMYYLLRKLTGVNWLSFIMAVLLPWINMQIFRLWAGHTAFSCSSMMMIAMCLMLLWHKYRLSRKRQVLVGLGMCLLALFGFISQGYYLVIITSFLSFMLFFYGLYYRREPLGKFSIISSAAVAVLSVGLVMLLLAITDSYLPMRPETATGYDWMEEKMRFVYFYTRYNFQHFYFPISRGLNGAEAEQAGYLGNVGLFAFTIMAIIMVLNKQFRTFIVQVQKDFFSDPFRGALFLGSVAVLFISFGEHYYTQEPHEQGLHIVNVFNILFYLHAFTKRVEQFRGLERFFWAFYYVFNFWIVYILVAVCREYSAKIKRLKAMVIGGVLLVGVPELLDYVKEMRHKTQYVNLFSAEQTKHIAPERIQPKRYQAILPIPYYFIGAEDYEYMIDDDELWSRLAYQLSMKWSLPLMTSKLSRTPMVYCQSLMKFVAFDTVDNLLRNKLNDKPVLVAVNQHLLVDGGNRIPTREHALKIYNAALKFAERNHLQAIDSANGVKYYEWYPPKKQQ